jgi:16S rRNA (cytidine1402-2'-O)-methyltransferase
MQEPSDSKGGSKRRHPPAHTTGAQIAGADRDGRGLLALVATPIGNLGDISARALDTLRKADLIACEDTRVTGNLLAKFDIQRPTLPYHDHNAETMRPKLIERLQRGETVALVSDAGTPLVSDPGYKLVREATDAGIAVTIIPGPSAPVAALVLSGLPSDRFLFAGFLPVKTVARRATLMELKAVPATLLFFETGPRLAESLADCHAVLGDRAAAVARELTKFHEEVRRDTLGALARHYAEAGAPKGEIVVVIAPPDAAAEPEIDIDIALEQALGEMSVKEAAAMVATASGRPRRAVYTRALEIAGRRPRDGHG